VDVACVQLALHALSCRLTARQWRERVAGDRVRKGSRREVLGYAAWIARCWRQPRRVLALLPAPAQPGPKATPPSAAAAAVQQLLNSSLLSGAPVRLEVVARPADAGEKSTCPPE
jgi:hypothetical protein